MKRKSFQHFEEESIEEPLINLTPLIDVVFVVLIAFVLIAPILQVDRINLATDGHLEKKQAQAGAILISVRADNTIWYEGSLVSLASLDPLLRQEKKKRPGALL